MSPLEHFRTLKTIYDNCPNRIWCISSRSLGVHAWALHPCWPTLPVHAWVKKQLASIGCGKVEVHPMPGRCCRRPFGLDYVTVTDKGEELYNLCLLALRLTVHGAGAWLLDKPSDDVDVSRMDEELIDDEWAPGTARGTRRGLRQHQPAPHITAPCRR
jgi:hypothetical protein